MKEKNGRFRPGDLVEVRPLEEVLKTLDADGTLGQLPFMPEMAQFCGQRFRIAKRVVKICTFNRSPSIRTFPTDDVVVLQGVRCSGVEHDGCPKACAIFWRIAWLREPTDATERVRPMELGQLTARLKTKSGPKTYFCQASELLKATRPLSRREKIEKCFSEVRAGNCSTVEMFGRIATWLFWRVRYKLLGPHAQGPNQLTPKGSLGLQAGESVEVKPMNQILETLNKAGQNQGLYFSTDMRQLCGATHTVERRLDKIIVDGTGEMRTVCNTVYLEGSHCGCAHATLGGCSRDEFTYWREIWLRRRS